MADVVPVVRVLVDAAFSTGGINDTQHTALLAELDAPDPPAPPVVSDVPPTVGTTTTTETPSPIPAFGQESNPYA